MASPSPVPESPSKSQNALVAAVAALFAVDLGKSESENDGTTIKEDLQTRSREELADLLIRADKELKRKELDLNVAANIGKQLLAQVNELKKSSSATSPKGLRRRGFHVPEDDNISVMEVEALLTETNGPPHTPDWSSHTKCNHHPRMQSLEEENYNLMLQLETSQAAYLLAEERGRKNLLNMEREIRALRKELEEASEERTVSKFEKSALISSGPYLPLVTAEALVPHYPLVENSEHASHQHKAIQIGERPPVSNSTQKTPCKPLEIQSVLPSPKLDIDIPQTSDTPANSVPLTPRESHLTDALKDKIEQLTRLNEEARVEFETKLSEMENYRDRWIRIERDSSLTDSPLRDRPRRRTCRVLANTPGHMNNNTCTSHSSDQSMSEAVHGIVSSLPSPETELALDDLEILDPDFHPIPLQNLRRGPVRSLSMELTKEFGKNWLDQFVEAEIELQSHSTHDGPGTLEPEGMLSTVKVCQDVDVKETEPACPFSSQDKSRSSNCNDFTFLNWSIKCLELLGVSIYLLYGLYLYLLRKAYEFSKSVTRMPNKTVHIE